MPRTVRLGVPGVHRLARIDRRRRALRVELNTEQAASSPTRSRTWPPRASLRPPVLVTATTCYSAAKYRRSAGGDRRCARQPAGRRLGRANKLALPRPTLPSGDGSVDHGGIRSHGNDQLQHSTNLSDGRTGASRAVRPKINPVDLASWRGVHLHQVVRGDDPQRVAGTLKGVMMMMESSCTLGTLAGICAFSDGSVSWRDGDPLRCRCSNATGRCGQRQARRHRRISATGRSDDKPTARESVCLSQNLDPAATTGPGRRH